VGAPWLLVSDPVDSVDPNERNRRLASGWRPVCFVGSCCVVAGSFFGCGLRSFEDGWRPLRAAG